MIMRICVTVTLCACLALAADNWNEDNWDENQLPTFAEKRNTITYTTAKPDGELVPGTCTQAQKNKIKAGIAAAGIIVKNSLHLDQEYVTKWFGQPTADEPNSDVLGRMRDGYAKMTAQDWKPVCCPPSGAVHGDCYSACGGGQSDATNTLAYVQSRSYVGQSDKETQYNQINYCASAFEMTDVQIGITTYHESIHMVSGAGDGTGDYSKTALVALAKSNPALARRTANSYTMYAAQVGTGDDWATYDQITSPWGGSVSSDGSCKDKYNNCADMVGSGNCMLNEFSYSIDKSDCCLSCERMQPPGSPPPCNDKYGNCNQLGGSSSSCTSGTVTGGQAIGTVCCKSCKAFVSLGEFTLIEK